MGGGHMEEDGWMGGFPQCSVLLIVRALAEHSRRSSKGRRARAAMRRHGPAHFSQLLKLLSATATESGSEEQACL